MVNNNPSLNQERRGVERTCGGRTAGSLRSPRSKRINSTPWCLANVSNSATKRRLTATMNADPSAEWSSDRSPSHPGNT